MKILYRLLLLILCFIWFIILCIELLIAPIIWVLFGKIGIFFITYYIDKNYLKITHY